MNCPVCGHPSRCFDTRPNHLGVRRRRECLDPKCLHRFTTYEQLREESVNEQILDLERRVEWLIDLALAKFADSEVHEMRAISSLVGIAHDRSLSKPSAPEVKLTDIRANLLERAQEVLAVLHPASF